MHKNPQKGIAILIAVVAVSAMLLIALAVSDIAFKEQVLTFYGRDSKIAYYAANAGIECALFHDFAGGVDGTFTFPTSTQSTTPGSLFCGHQSLAIYDSRNDIVSGTTEFYFNLETIPRSCSYVKVRKTSVAGVVTTRIESRGYNNTCAEESNPNRIVLDDNPRNIERALLMTY